MNANKNGKENILQNIQTPKVFYMGFAVILFLLFCLSLIYFKTDLFLKKSSSTTETTKNIINVLCFCLLIFIITISLIPNFKDFKELFQQISSVTYAIIYTIGVILFFGFVPSEWINKYAHIILPVAGILGLGLFYKAGTYSYIDEFNINYERIKMVILFLCLITTFFIFYKVDPGGYISKYFGESAIIAISIGFFALLYLIIVISLPERAGSDSANLFDKFLPFTNILTKGFYVYLFIFIAISIYIFQGDSTALFNDTSSAIAFFVISLLILIIWAILVVVNAFPGLADKAATSNTMLVAKRSILMLFGIVISSLFIVWIATSIQDYSGQSSIVSLLLNIAIIIIIMGIIYKTIYVELPVGNSKKNAFFNLIMSILFYIPCLFTGIFDSAKTMTSSNYNASDTTSIGMIAFCIVLFIIYFRMPSIFNIINTQGGKQLVNKPVNTNTEYALGTYIDLNGSEQYDYQYGISFWVLVHSAAANMNENYNKYTSLLNFGGKPNVLYNARNNTLLITIDQAESPNNNKLTEYNENGHRILYKNDKFLLQKWNNIIINYSGGVLDIFLNGELVKSNLGVVPYYKLDSLTIGQNKGIEGGICNLVYFRKPLTTANIYFLYNMVKNRSPPVLNEDNRTILIENIKQVGAAMNDTGVTSTATSSYNSVSNWFT